MWSANTSVPVKIWMVLIHNPISIQRSTLPTPTLPLKKIGERERGGVGKYKTAPKGENNTGDVLSLIYLYNFRKEINANSKLCIRENKSSRYALKKGCLFFLDHDSESYKRPRKRE